MSSKHESLGRDIIQAAVQGKIGGEEMSAMFAVLNGAPLLIEESTLKETRLGMREFVHVLDRLGETLVSGGKYTYRGKKMRVLREEFGEGNIMDTYYRVFYIDETLDEGFLVVDGSYPNGIFSGAVYQSELMPILE